MAREDREHAVYVRLRPEVIDWLRESKIEQAQWPIRLHGALAREAKLPEAFWPPRPVGRPPNSTSPAATPKPAARKAKGKFWSNVKAGK